MYYQLAGIRKNFNVIGLDLNQIDNDTIYFWYELLLRIYLRSDIWSKISTIHNLNRTGFLVAYDKLETKEEKKSFIKEIKYFVDGCTRITARKKGEQEATFLKENLYNIINYELLDLKCFFDTYDFQEFVREIKISDTNEMLKNPVNPGYIKKYQDYLSKIKKAIIESIDTINKEFAASNAQSFCITVDENSFDNDSEQSILEKLVKKLKEIDAVAYRKLTVENYDDIINKTDYTMTISEQQRWHDKVQKDLMKIFEEDKELLVKAVEEHLCFLL